MDSLLKTHVHDYQYESCKKHERETNYVKCDSCKNRFVCWTSKSNIYYTAKFAWQTVYHKPPDRDDNPPPPSIFR